MTTTNQNQNPNNQTSNTQESKREELDLSMDMRQLSLECSLVDEEMDIDPSQDAYSGSAPIPDGQHKFKLMFVRANSATTKKGKSYISIDVECSCIDSEFEGMKVFDSPTTIIPMGKNINGIVGMLKELGVNIPKGKLKVIDQVRMLKDALANEPILEGVTQWQGYSKNKEKTILTGMVNFPKGDGGKYNHIVNVQGEEVSARAQVKRWVGNSNPLWGYRGGKGVGMGGSMAGASSNNVAVNLPPAPKVEAEIEL